MTSTLKDVAVEDPCLRQKGDPFVNNHGIGDGLYCCLREFSPIFQLFYKSGKEFRGVVGTHHLHRVLLEVCFVNCPIAG